jgi:predicted secreted protein
MAVLLPNSVYIHIPKTAGRWVASALENAGLTIATLGTVHSTPAEIRHERPFIERQTVFALVRHPLTWYQSMWAHRMDENWDPIDDLDWFTPGWIEEWARFSACRSDDFRQFVKNCIDQFPDGWVSSLYGHYTSGCSVVGKQEGVPWELIRILANAGERFDPNRILTTQPENVRASVAHRRADIAYTRDLAELMMGVESRAIERFGYHDIPESISREF